jgi:hypothetical protein
MMIGTIKRRMPKMRAIAKNSIDNEFTSHK